MLQVKSINKKWGINFPTELNEFTPELLSSITANVKLPKYYCVIALCFEVKLLTFAMEIRNNKGGTSNVIPLLCKAHAEDLVNMNGLIGDKVILDRSSIERGHKLNVPIMITSNNSTAYIKEDDKLLVNIIQGKPNDPHITDPIIQNMVDNKNSSIFIVEFKIVPVNDIVACIPVDSTVIDPFKIKHIKLVN